jgi:hypothetical protein
MAGMEMEEMRMLVACAKEGSAMIDRHMRKDAPERFVGRAPFLPQGINTFEAMADLLYAKNVDFFYVFLSVCFATDVPGKVRELIGGLDRREALRQSLRFIEHALYAESDFERELAANIHTNTAQGDEQIKKAFSARFNVSPMSLMELPTDRSVYFAKVNHGYWEYMRHAYDDDHAERDQFRETDVQSRIRRLRSSGVTQHWAWQIHQYFRAERSPGVESQLSISLTAGTESPIHSIRKTLNPVTRGAAIGLISMFETALPAAVKCEVGDGGATRALIFDKTLKAFFEKYVADSEACLLVTPPHLKMLDLVDYKGRMYKFLVPPTRVNETWKVVASALLGYMVRVSKKHKTITVLAQGASIASLMALLFSNMEVFSGTRIRFIDLGRVLDVAVPDFLEKQAWAKSDLAGYIAEGGTVFRMNEAQPFDLASPV